jgi:hypothetical protein
VLAEVSLLDGASVVTEVSEVSEVGLAPSVLVETGVVAVVVWSVGVVTADVVVTA